MPRPVLVVNWAADPTPDPNPNPHQALPVPRPVLVVNSAADPRCPRAGVEAAMLAARAVLGLG